MSKPILYVIHPAEEGGYWAEIPSLPGCVSQGETLPEIEANIREAALGWIQAQNEKARDMVRNHRSEVGTRVKQLAFA